MVILLRKKLNKKGFTLMEVMVAIAIVAIVSGPLLQTFITSGRVGRRSYDVDKANTVSVKTVETVKGDPAGVNTSNYAYSVRYDGDIGKFIHTYARTQYYDVNWNGPYASNPSGDYPFNAVTTVTGQEDAASGVSLSYLPELVVDSGARMGQNYRIEADYTLMNSGSYLLTVTGDSAKYTVSASQAILKSTLSGVTNIYQEIPLADCVSGIIPVVVDAGQNPVDYVSFVVDNQTGVELGIYIYGDYYNTPHFVTATLTSGVMTVNYMKVASTTLSYDKLDVNVKVFRDSDGSEITDYTTMIYLAQ